MADRKRFVVKKGGMLNFLPLGLFNRLRRTQYSSPGMAIVLGLCVFTILLWAFPAAGDSLGPYVILAKITAFGGIALLALNHILSLRARTLEVLFGGLDKLYHAHHLVGQIAFLMMVLHPVFLALNRFGSPQFNVFFYLVPMGNFGVALGIIALYATLALLMVTLVFKLRYHIWHLSHHLMLIPL
ncbi:MAG: ferric reductase-like transmembrane domain-containing protein, partial [Candidatus Thermoplasmatota archaeon]|nr:ferric reductase-like transmembrane domain-containing protein [Candidatus Thermoplasmatota archaeon]